MENATLRSRKVVLSIGTAIFVDASVEFPQEDAASAIVSSAFAGNNLVDRSIIGIIAPMLPFLSKLNFCSEFTSGMVYRENLSR